ncbi:MAG: peptidoglycan DD-metalloendopeptidase family protein [Bacteroidota bacterium]|nr:metalloendopeptidase [Odoribacter sp.]MDP3645216.1 peptidoglycan DD-metalloendopeptidase family protein [Bacteroidota bacterium]
MKIYIPQKYQRLKRILIWIVSFIVLLQVAYFIYDQYETKRIMKELAREKEVERPEPVMLFNLPVDSFNVVSGKVRSGQNLSEILSKQGILMTKIDEISKKSVLIFDVRKMKVNNPFYFFKNKKDSSKIEYFIYEINKVDYVVFQLSDSLRIYKEKKPIVTMVKTASGVITSSLWNAMAAQALDRELIMNLSEIYQWSIDFFGIQKGDKFRIIFEEDFVYGKSIGTGRIFAAQFVHAKEDFYAFHFTQNNEESYFDDKGKSLKKAFLKAPLKFNRISSQFSNARFHPVLKIYRPHHGVDYAAPTGTPVLSIGDGTIVAKAYQAAGGGNYLKVKHNSLYTTSYMHLSKFAQGIGVGKRVRQGEVIGYVGTTGLSSGPHLDFRVFMNGSPVNPLTIKSPPTEPVFEKNMKEYTALKDSMMTRLMAIKNF